MKKFDYKCVSIVGWAESTTRVLKSYGDEGWELVAVYWIWHYFKKERE